MNCLSIAREREYIESSHRCILAQANHVAVLNRARSVPRSPVTYDVDDRRAHARVPSLIESVSMSLGSTNTLSPITPKFDMSKTRASPHPPSHQRQPTPLDFDTTQPALGTKRVNPPAIDTEFDSASTYQPRPRRIIPIQRPTYESQQSPTSATTEISFVEWDDGPSRLRRMKQSLTFQLPQRPNRADQGKVKNPDKHLNAIPRLPFRTKSNSKLQSQSVTSQPTTRSSSTQQHHHQQRLPQACAPVSFDQLWDNPTNTWSHTIELPRSRYPEDTRDRHIHSTAPPQGRRSQQVPVDIGHRTMPAPTTLARSVHPTNPSTRQYHTRKHRHEQPASYSRLESHAIVDERHPQKPKRLLNMVHGVMERVSTRDLRRQADQGK